MEARSAYSWATLMPGVARSVVTWGAAGVINDPDRRLREAMYNIVDHPILPLQQFRDFLVATYGETNARAMTQSHVDALSDIIKGEAGLSRSKADTVCTVLLIAGQHGHSLPPPLPGRRSHYARQRCSRRKGAEHNVYADRPEWVTQTILDWVGKH